MHWARDAEECNRIVGDLIAAHGADEVVKAKSLTTEETKLNEALAQRGIRAWETDLAQLIIQLADDTPSHILVPAIHKNREQIRELFAADAATTRRPTSPTTRARWPRPRAAHLRKLFLGARVGISGVNFAVADTGTVSVVESEGNGRMCTTLPEVLISVMGIEKVIPDVGGPRGLPPAAAAILDRGADEPVHVAVDRGDRRATGRRSSISCSSTTAAPNVLADEIGRQALNCIRCSACLNVCPVYERTGGHAYGSTYPGPIGAILTPMLSGMTAAALAAVRVEPVRRLLRGVPGQDQHPARCSSTCATRRWRAPRTRARRARAVAPEHVAMRAMARVFANRRLYEAAQRAGRLGAVAAGPRREDPAAARAAVRLDRGARSGPAAAASELPRLVAASGDRERRARGDPRAHPRRAGRRPGGRARPAMCRSRATTAARAG